MILPESPRRTGLRPGPKPRLSREKIVEAAIELGVEQVSIGAVAAALNAAPASLYRYIDSLDDLVLAAIESIFAGTPLPAADAGWRAYLEAEAAIRFDLLMRYAGLVPDNAAGLAGVAAQRVERLVRRLVAFGFTVDDAVLAVDAVADLVHDGVTQIVRLRDPDDPRRLSPAMATSLTVYSPEVRAAVERIIHAPRAHLWRKLAITLDGLAARLSRS